MWIIVDISSVMWTQMKRVLWIVGLENQHVIEKFHLVVKSSPFLWQKIVQNSATPRLRRKVVTSPAGSLRHQKKSGWWLGHPSEKYERQLRWLANQFVGKCKMATKPPTRIIVLWMKRNFNRKTCACPQSIKTYREMKITRYGCVSDSTCFFLNATTTTNKEIEYLGIPFLALCQVFGSPNTPQQPHHSGILSLSSLLLASKTCIEEVCCFYIPLIFLDIQT